MGDTRRRPFCVSQNGYPFSDHWFARDGVAMHYVDEGSGTPVLMLHGNPTWSYLYRHVIKELAGMCRCIAPDYPGFGLPGGRGWLNAMAPPGYDGWHPAKPAPSEQKVSPCPTT